MSAILANLPKPAALLPFLLGSAAVFWVVILALWGVETVWNRVFFPGDAKQPSFLGRFACPAAIRFALLQTLWIAPVTIACSYAGQMLARRFGWELPPQDILVWLRDGDWALRALIIVFASVSAPVTEELIFRRFLFRALLRRLPFAASAFVSAVLFSAIHRNLAVFPPIVFLGFMLAWLYWRTGRIVAPMACHLAFNALNIVLVCLFPELV